MFVPVIDVKHTPYCGPTAVAALTGVPLSRIEKMLRRSRKGFKDRLGRKRQIKGTHSWEIKRVLKGLGCKITQVPDPERTFGRFVRDTAHINATFLVNVTGHYMVTRKGLFCDNSHLAGPVPIDGYHRALRRVQHAWRIDAPAVPMYTVDDPIAPPPRARKPKPPIAEVRAARVDAAIKKWEAKRKRAETALRKLRKQERYYVRRSSGSGVPRSPQSGDQGEARSSPA